jgi:hypothetical protein|nr:MAG TPA: hypothetical protein [Caudoviricetes sp.]
MKETVKIRFGIDNVLYAKSGEKFATFVIAVAENKVIYVPDFKCEFGTIRDEHGWAYCLNAEIERKYFKLYNSNSQKFENLVFNNDQITFENLEKLEEEQTNSNCIFKKHSFMKMHEMCNVKCY